MTKRVPKRKRGFSTLEMLIVIAMAVIIAAIAVPSAINTSNFLRIQGDLRALNGATAQAKMRAAADFTHARVFADLNNNQWQLQVWNKTAGSSGKGCWVPDTDPSNTCVTYSGSTPNGAGVNRLRTGDSFGFGSLTSGPTPGQTTIQQAAGCYKGNPSGPDGGAQINNTACVEFNSRGIPVDNTGAPLATGAYYVNNGGTVIGVTVSATGSIQAWQMAHGASTWQSQ